MLLVKTVLTMTVLEGKASMECILSCLVKVAQTKEITLVSSSETQTPCPQLSDILRLGRLSSVTSPLVDRLKLTSSCMALLNKSSLSITILLESLTFHHSGHSAGNKLLGNTKLKKMCSSW